ncbi:hypothetical protein MGSAQ_000684 [marine sediment metagenome]|uniref:Uncharacterized protein n=1 Tax=marine sediment metagenome TaxID=412755 RepID=A0A1B6NWM2_9ZZZZ
MVESSTPPRPRRWPRSRMRCRHRSSRAPCTPRRWAGTDP